MTSIITGADVSALLDKMAALQDENVELRKDRDRLDALLHAWETGGHYDVGLTFSDEGNAIACVPDYWRTVSHPKGIPRRWVAMIGSTERAEYPIGQGRDAIDAARKRIDAVCETKTT